MITVEVTANISYVCQLSVEDEEKVKAYAEENNTDLVDAVNELYWRRRIDLYKNFVESDFNTESIDDAYEE